MRWRHLLNPKCLQLFINRSVCLVQSPAIRCPNPGTCRLRPIRTPLLCTHAFPPLPVARSCPNAALHSGTDFRIWELELFCSCSYPNRSDTIPAWVAIIVPFILVLISLFIGEFILFKKVHRNITHAVSTVWLCE